MMIQTQKRREIQSLLSMAKNKMNRVVRLTQKKKHNNIVEVLEKY